MWNEISPGNTIMMSPAFVKKVTQSSSLNITNGLAVKAMINAMKRYNTNLVLMSLSKQLELKCLKKPE